jgi:hypothetical protein
MSLYFLLIEVRFLTVALLLVPSIDDFTANQVSILKEFEIF